MVKRTFICKFHFVSWYQISLGITINLYSPNVEIHLPFGFFKLGMEYAAHFKRGKWEDLK